MSRRQVRIAVLAAVAVVLAALSAMAFVSRAAAPKPTMPDAQLAAIETAPQVSKAEAATVREPRRGKPTEPAADATITAHARTIVAGESWKIVSYRAKSGALCAGVLGLGLAACDASVTTPITTIAANAATIVVRFSRGVPNTRHL